MKKITIALTSLALIVLVTYSCTEEEKLIGYPYKQENSTQNLVGTVTTSTPINGEGWKLPISVTIPRTFTSDVTLEVTATLKSGLQSIVDTLSIEAGGTTVDGIIPIPVDPPDSKFDGIENYMSVELTAILLEELEPGVNYTISSDPLLVDLYNYIQWPYPNGTVGERMTYLVDWANPSINDLDVYVIGLEQLEDAESGDRYETDIFNDTHPDGTYTIDAVAASISEENIPWKVFFVYPNQETFRIFEGTLTGAVEGETYPLVQFTKTTDPVTEEVTYSNVIALD